MNRVMNGLMLASGLLALSLGACNGDRPEPATVEATLQTSYPAPRRSHTPPAERRLVTYPKDDGTWIPYEPGVVLVKFREGISGRTVDEGLAAELGLVRAHARSPIGVERLTLTTRESVEAAVERLRRDPRVVYAEPNYKIRLLNVPNDARYDELWGMNNTGQTGGTADADIDAQEAWDISIGSYEVVVAVLDTGVDYTHEDLAANMWTNEDEIPGNGVDDDNNGYVDDVIGWDFEHEVNDPMDDYGHGTHCSGTIGAVGNNGIGVAGVNWRVTIMPLRIIGSQDYDTYCLDAAESIYYAVDNGARVMSCSWWTVETYSLTLENAVAYAEQQGVFLVAAAGNYTSDVETQQEVWPCEWPYDNIICVAATTHTDNIAYFSNWGAVSVDVGAPGEGILSTVWPGGYDVYDGTSMATPHVAGTVALMLSIRPELTMAEVKQYLFTTVDPIADLQGITVTGGRINAFTVMQAISGVPLPPVALAGGDRTVMTGSTVQLDGSASFDPNQDPITYDWDFYPPSHSSATLSDELAVDPTFVADVCGEFQAFLTVQDDGGLTSEPDRARIHVMNWTDNLVESPHPYPDGYDNTWTIYQPGAVVIAVHFASFDTESGWDFVTLYDGNDVEQAVYDGNLGSFTSVVVQGDTIKVRLTSDSMINRDGFVIDGQWWCDAGRCPPGLGDCDDDPGTGPDGCESDTTGDINNCGWCGHICSFPHASSTCQSGICVIQQCDAGWTDCDLDPLTGCESDLLVDPDNCGSCGSPCGPYPNATPGCAGGSCAIGACDPGWDDCNGVLGDGCEMDVTSDVNNCGACNNVCNLDHTVSHSCIGGECYPLGACTEEALSPPVETPHPYPNSYDNTWTITRPGSAEMAVHFASFETENNYDFVYIYDANDVEYAMYDGTLGAFWSVSVPGNTIKIRLTSDSIINDDGFVIDLVRRCDSGCEGGYGNCDGDPANGCESDVSSDVNNCGGCGEVCGTPGMDNECIGGVCFPGTVCDTGFDDCDGDPLNGCETDLENDPLNCSACGTVCQYDHADDLCSGGTCQMGACEAGYGDCNGQDTDGCETSLIADPDNCGACGDPCVLPHVDHAYCEGGVCEIGECQVYPENIETPHPYGNDMDQEWFISHPGASEIQVHFSMFDLEFNSSCSWDWVQLFDGQDNLIATYCGDLGAFLSDPVPGDTVRVVFHSDYTVTREGFILDWSRVCSGSGCSTGWDNCDGDTLNGCESDVSSDPSNCGACGQPCVFDHATGDCQNSACVIGTCDQDWGDCNADGTDGCETDLLGDPDHCSGCDNTCAFDHAAATCQAGACIMGSCDAGFDDCNGSSGDGCETDLDNDPSNCSACDNACGPFDHATPGCQNGSCTVGSCDSGWDDCDGQAANGCESDVSADTDNCGGCGVSCDVNHAADVTCVDSVCVIHSCEQGWGNCDDDERNGCETELASDVDNCGACGAPCTFANGGGICQDSACVLTSCTMGYSDCNGEVADGCEASLRDDEANCGWCGNACAIENGTSECVDGSCSFTGCLEGFADCNQDLATDGCEVSIGGDPANCGGCGEACDLAHATAGCDAGACIVDACDAGYGNCDADDSNGCETDLLGEAAHCGACGQACNLAHATASCDQGDCTVSACDADFQNCNGDDNDGCEVDLNTSSQHCGQCRHACGEGQICADGACVCPDGDGDGHEALPCGDDCDDTSADVHPDAEEVCKDEIDNDCDGSTDEGCPDDVDPGDTGGGGCGCASSPSGMPLAAWLALAGLAIVRRRRSSE